MKLARAIRRANDPANVEKMTSNKINLLHTVLSLNVAGLERLVSEISLKMNGDIFNVEVCCFDRLGYFAEVLEDNGIKVTLLQRNQNHFDLYHPWRLRKFLRKENIDIIHAHTGTFFDGALAGKLARCRAIVYTEHGRFVVEPKVRIIEDRIAARLANKIIAVSSELENYLIEKIRFKKSKVVTIVNGVNMSRFSPRPKPENLLKEFGIPASYKVVGTVGRLQEVKDHLTLIKSFQIVSKRLPQTRLMLVGHGHLKQQLLEYVQANNLGQQVIFTGVRKDVAELLNLFDVFVLSSLSEGTSVSLLEAMASGVPPVVTDVGGNPLIVDHSVDGLIVKPRNISQMAETIIGLLNDNDRRNLLGRNAVSKVRKKYSLDRMVDAYKDIYLGLLERKNYFGSESN